ncbi:Phospholipid scramblase 1 [Holothuria leucospilota]|uniref:Phospholipid scramblase n=1 Tax=Holothuria leucospilota TaxID=206669 RepID=A0A9Q1BDD0_HOLLE|nr:Phospholipid scramblase 1 [Holothuria leucospilota]
MSHTESTPDSQMNQRGTELQIPGHLSGLAKLETIDKLFVKQEVNVCEVVSFCYQAKSKYVITNESGLQLYHAYEDSGCCSRHCCCASRALTMHVMDMNGQEIIRVNKSLQTCSGLYCCIVGQNCCAYRIEVESPPGRTVGTVAQSCSIWRKPKFVVLDNDDNQVFSINGSCDWPCTCCCMCQERPFRFYSKDGTEIGKCAKKWSGCGQEVFTQANNFTITFPQDLDIKEKATLFGAVFLIDILHYE